MSRKKGSSTIDDNLMEIIETKLQEKTNTNIKCELLEKDIEHMKKYIELLAMQQSSMLKKMDSFMDSLLTRIMEESSKTIDRVLELENKVRVLTENIDNLEADINLEGPRDNLSTDSATTKNNTDSADPNDEPEFICDDCRELHGFNSPPHGMTVRIRGDEINPLQMLLLKQLDKMSHDEKKNTTQNGMNDDSDNEYDETKPIYDDTDIISDDDFQELNKKISNIDDIISLGIMKKKYDDEQIKKKNSESDTSDDELKKITKKGKKQKKRKNKNKITQSENIFETHSKKYSIDLNTICKLVEPLKKLKKMIGMQRVKDDIFDMIIYYLQGFEQSNNAMLHTVIEGPPGVGKTRLGKIIAQIYCALGVIPSNKFKYVRATDLIGDHVGVTKHMTQSVIDEADGGVLFIDEAYALSTDKKKDPYGQECLDTLNFNLSENKKKLIVIIAGYAEQLEKHFFSYNAGLKRRFPFRYKIESYTSVELRDIFIDKMKKFGWKLNKEVSYDELESFFKHHINNFQNFGGDVENFFKSCQFMHSRRVLGKHPLLRKKLTLIDLNSGLKKFIANKPKDDKFDCSHMYI